MSRLGRKKKKVFVGMSGGVDSSVSAALLKEQGYDVTGVFIKVWSPDWLPCDWKEERRDAMRVAAKLGIPFKTLNCEAEYKSAVVDYMIDEYKSGRTPNPDVMCNKYVKFGVFLKKAKEMGADFVATGHYARVKESKIRNYELREGKDKEKDQSYFLWTLSQKELAPTLFPVGHLQKSEVRKLAKKYDLPTAEKKDSQGLCFIGKVDIKDFLKHFVKAKEGDVLDENGKSIGHHEGAVFYTIGQRHGFVVKHTSASDKPFFVVSKDITKNTITVSHKHSENDNLRNTKEVKLRDINFVAGLLPDTSRKYGARLRYRQSKQKCSLNIVGDSVSVIFDQMQSAVTSGQSLVLYDGDVCIGGGIIV